MATTGHESEAINVSGLKKTLQKMKTDLLPSVPHYVTSASGTAGSTASGSYNRTQWTGNAAGISALATGAMVLLKIPVEGCKYGVSLNINGLGEHPVVLNVNTMISTLYAVGAILPLVYDADQKASIYVSNTNTEYTGCWKIANYDSNTTYTPLALGFCTGQCDTAAGTAAKAVTMSKYTLVAHGIVSIKFTYAITVASATLNINTRGAKAIYYKGAALAANVIEAGDIVTMQYNGTQYVIIGIVRASGIPKSDLASAVQTSLGKADTALQSHQDISGKADKSATVSTVSYDTTNKKITKTINGTTTDVVSASTLKTDMGLTKSDVGLGNVGNFKAVSTAASQGLTSTEQSNARANIGAGTSSFSGSYNDLTNKPTIPAAAKDGVFSVKTKVGSNSAVTVADFSANQSSADDVTLIQGNNVTLTTDATNRTVTIAAADTTYSAATTSAAGLMSAADKTKLNGIAMGATAVSEATVSGWGFTKNAGTVTGVKINGTTKSPSGGVVDLGTVLTSHQDISGKADKATTIAGYGITDAYTKSETYSKEEINDHIDTPNQGYITAVADSNTTTANLKTLIDTAAGSDKEKADFIYRVGCWDGSQYNDTMYSVYAWINGAYALLSKKSQVDEVFDISAYHANTKYADLAAALNGGTNIPQSLRKGGMSVKFVQSDNKYAQARCMAQNFTTDVTQWQGVDNKPTAESDNLVKSGGVAVQISELDNLTREFVLSAVNNRKAFITKESFNYTKGYYSISNNTVVYNSGLHNSIKIPAIGYSLEKIVFRGTSISIAASNIILERNDGEVYGFTLDSEGDYVNLNENFSLSVESEKLKNIYINYFYLDDSNYKFEFQFRKTILQNLTFSKEDITVKNEAIYNELGVVLDTLGYISSSGVLVPLEISIWKCCTYIPVVPGDLIKYRLRGQNNVCVIAFYNINKEFVSGLVPEGTQLVSGNVTVPDSCYYIQCCCYDNEVDYDDMYIIINSQKSFKERFLDLKKYISLSDSIKKPIVFSGKVINAFGDSITAGVSSPNLTPAGNNSYINLFKDYVGATLQNHAESGSCIVPGQNEITSIYEKIISISSACDIIIIAGGINDWQTQSAIGQFGDDNTTTLYGVLKKICDYIKSTYPNACVIFITPIPTTSTLTFGVQHPDNLNLYRRAIQEVAMYNGYNVVNGADLGLPDSKTPFGNAMFAPEDCIHPTLAGHALFARSLTGKLL